MNELSFLNQSQYQLYSRIVARYCSSVNAAIMLSELINRFEYHQEKNELISHEKHGDGWFYLTIDKCEERTCLSRKEQDTGLGILKEKDFIQVQVFGVPGKRHFKLNAEKILEIFGLSKNNSRLSEKGKVDCPKRAKQDDRKGQTYTYKEPHQELQEEQQQNQDPQKEIFDKDAALAAAAFSKEKIYDCLCHLDMSDKEKISLSKLDSEEVVILAVAKFMQKLQSGYKMTNPYGMLKKLIEDKERPLPISNVSSDQNNRSIAIKMQNSAIMPSFARIDVLTNHAEIIYDSQRQPDIFNYNENGFKEKFENAIRKCGGYFKKKE